MEKLIYLFGSAVIIAIVAAFCWLKNKRIEDGANIPFEVRHYYRALLYRIKDISSTVYYREITQYARDLLAQEYNQWTFNKTSTRGSSRDEAEFLECLFGAKYSQMSGDMEYAWVIMVLSIYFNTPRLVHIDPYSIAINALRKYADNGVKHIVEELSHEYPSEFLTVFKESVRYNRVGNQNY